MDTVSEPNEKSEQFLVLRDGRRLGFQILGDPDGYPLLIFHGTPGSRLALSSDDAIAKVPGLKLVCLERPGYGISDPQPSRTICSWAEDICEFADSLELRNFSVLGSSGGGPYALACGTRLESRVDRVILLNSAAPIDFKGAMEGMSFGNRLGYRLSRYAPWIFKQLIKLSAGACVKSPESTVRSLENQLAPADRKFLQDDEFVNAVARDMREAFRHGIEGHYRDALLAYAKSGWGFEFEDVSVPVHLWHGEQDTLSPIQTVKRMAARFPNCQSTYLPHAGHFLIDLPEVVEGISSLCSE